MGPKEEESKEKRCYECDQVHEPLIQPCMCTGHYKFIHPSCLNEHRIDKNKYSRCKRCKQYYVLEQGSFAGEEAYKRKTVNKVRRDVILYLIGSLIIFVSSLFAGAALNYTVAPFNEYIPDSWEESVPPVVFGLFLGFVLFCFLCDLAIIGIIFLRTYATKKPENIAKLGGILFCVLWCIPITSVAVHNERLRSRHWDKLKRGKDKLKEYKDPIQNAIKGNQILQIILIIVIILTGILAAVAITCFVIWSINDFHRREFVKHKLAACYPVKDLSTFKSSPEHNV